MGIDFSDVLGTVWISASPKILKKKINLKCLCFPIVFPYYGNPFVPCFKFWELYGFQLLMKYVRNTWPFFYVFSYFSHTIGNYFSHDLGIYFFINYVLGQYYCVKTDIPLNMIIGIGLKIDPGWLQQKCISGYFSQIGDINNTHRWLLLKCLWKQMSWSPFKVKQCKNSKIVIF